MFQAILYVICRERNGRRYGKSPSTTTTSHTILDKNVWDMFITIQRMRDKSYKDGLGGGGGVCSLQKKKKQDS